MSVQLLLELSTLMLLVTLFLWSVAPASIAFGHFVWLRESLDSNAVITFNEKAGVPGPAFLLSMVANKINLSTHDEAGGQQALALSTLNTTGGSAELVAHLNVQRPFSLELAATFGIWPPGAAKPSLLKYYANSNMVTKPNDWFLVQDWSGQTGLEITIRDPWMNSSLVDLGAGARGNGDECKPHGGPTQDGAACVVSVIRFNGELLAADVNLTTFTSSGAKLNATHSPDGVTILKVPLDVSKDFTEVFASVNYREHVSGEYNGDKYFFVDHWATTYARIHRSKVSTESFLI